MLRRALSATLMIASLAVAGCVTPEMLEEPRISLQNVRIMKAEGLMQTLLVDLLIENPNDFSIPVTGLDFALNVNGADFARGLSNQRVVIPRLGQATVPVEVNVSLLSVVRLLQTFRAAQALDYAIDGKIYLDHFVMRTVPFDRTGSLALQRDGEGGFLAPI